MRILLISTVKDLMKLHRWSDRNILSCPH